MAFDRRDSKKISELAEKAFESKKRYRGLRQESIEYAMKHHTDKIKVPDASYLVKLRDTDLPQKGLWIDGLVEKMKNLPKQLDELDLPDRRDMLQNLLQWNKFIYEMRKTHQNVDFIPKWGDGKMR